MIRLSWKKAATCLIVATQLAGAQQHSRTAVSPRNMYERLVTVVPLVGAGTYADPRRPMYAPLPSQASPTSRKGIVAYSYQLSDDGKYALVEFVAQDPTAFKDILADTSIKTFQKGLNTADDITQELKKYKKDFDITRFGVVRVP